MIDAESVTPETSEKRPPRFSLKTVALQVLIIIAFFVCWQVLGGFVNPLFFASPGAVLQSLPSVFDASLSGLETTFLEIGLGFALGTASGVILGLVLGSVGTARSLFSSLVLTIHATPKIIFYPFLVLLFGFGAESKIVMGSISSFFPIVIAVLAGIMGVEPTFHKVARSMNFSKLQTYRLVVIPNIIPLLLSGMRLGFNICIVAVLSAQLISSVNDIGTLLNGYSYNFDAANLFSLVIILSVLSIAINYFLLFVQSKATPWSR